MPIWSIGINGYSISANAPAARADATDVERALRDVNDAYKEQIAALTAERDRLRRYVRALKATRDTAPGDPAWGNVATEWEDVCREIARHGDLEDDDANG